MLLSSVKHEKIGHQQTMAMLNNQSIFHNISIHFWVSQKNQGEDPHFPHHRNAHGAGSAVCKRAWGLAVEVTAAGKTWPERWLVDHCNYIYTYMCTQR